MVLVHLPKKKNAREAYNKIEYRVIFGKHRFIFSSGEHHSVFESGALEFFSLEYAMTYS